MGSGKKEITFDYAEINKALEYAAEDALVTLKLFNFLNKRVKTEKNNFVYNEIDLPLVHALYQIEKNGIKINTNYLNELSKEFEKESFEF